MRFNSWTITFRKRRKNTAGSTVVAVLTGNGLKDPQTAIDVKVAEPHKLESNASALSAFIEEVLV